MRASISQGLKQGDLSTFVDTAVRAEVLRRTITEIHDRNEGLSAEEAQRLADEAVAATRAILT